MKEILDYLKPIIEDENNEPSRKRLLEIMCIATGCFLTTTTCFWKYKHPELDVATLTMLIAPLFATGLVYSGITSFYQSKIDIKKEDGIQNNT